MPFKFLSSHEHSGNLTDVVICTNVQYLSNTTETSTIFAGLGPVNGGRVDVLHLSNRSREPVSGASHIFPTSVLDTFFCSRDSRESF
ncbi:hypothetical protein CEXT_69811 [Caerostris extrusa]|uniref:Uncharacterized protein n=1 Tax=Caerostris extrusa TaxID=172846 RepID=A0AAV4NWH6_CAEEX|nr:hypothetical protein CEXT_69811 [Caerostris extrusa]